MTTIYDIAGLSKQAFHRYLTKTLDKQDLTAFYIQLIEQARSLHPVIGLKKIYHLFHPEGIGRDAFINIGSLAGYSLDKHPRLSWKGARVIPYQNLLSDRLFNDINQVWATDITYYKIGDRYFYISMIMDLYSRKIIAAGVSNSLRTESSLIVLRKAFRSRVFSGNQLIHHSDKGTQYTSLQYTKALKNKGIKISMCNSVFENTAMERLNGIIKNDYLIHWDPKSLNHLVRLTKKAVKHYNNCPHGKLSMLSPNDYEKQLPQIPLNQRTKLKVFTFKKSIIKNPNQLELFTEMGSFVNQKGQPFSG